MWRISSTKYKVIEQSSIYLCFNFQRNLDCQQLNFNFTFKLMVLLIYPNLRNYLIWAINNLILSFRVEC